MYEDLFQHIPLPSFLIATDGRILAANHAAADRFDQHGDADGWGNVLSLFSTSDRLRRDIMRASGGTGWIPSAGWVSTEGLSGMKVSLRMRGLVLPGHESPRVLMVLRQRDDHFREHSRLIRDLNARLAREQQLTAELRDSVAREKYLHRELIHRVKNNLALLSSIIRHRLRAETGTEARAALETIDLRTRSIALVHELLDRNDTVRVLRSSELIGELCALLNDALLPANVTLDCEVDTLDLHNEDATALCLLINELVTNSLKHAFAGQAQGRIELNFRRNGVDKMELKVRDDGRGMPADGATRAEVPPAGSGAGAGHGKQILHALARNLRGELVQRSDDGTEWTLIFHPRPSDPDLPPDMSGPF